MNAPIQPSIGLFNQAEEQRRIQDSLNQDILPEVHNYISTIPNINYVFRNGKQAIFLNGKFSTRVTWEVQELDAEVVKGHPHISKDPIEPTMDPKYVDPMVRLKEKIISEHEAAKAAAIGTVPKDMGNYTPPVIKPASTNDGTNALVTPRNASGGVSTFDLAGLKERVRAVNVPPAPVPQEPLNPELEILAPPITPAIVS